MDIAIAGSSGFIGTAVSSLLRERGHTVRPMLRPSSEPRAGGIRWNPAGGTVDAAALDGVDAVLNLAGTSIGAQRWTAKQKAEMSQSRLQSTGVLATAIAAMSRPPRVFVSASAAGYYGERGDEIVVEEDPAPEGLFLSELTQRWEAAAAPAAAAGVRTVITRTGIVLGASGGLLKPLLPLFKLGLGARLGNGKQWMPWISIRDQARALVFLLEHETADGPYNICAPEQATNADFTANLAAALGRPAFLFVPHFVLSTVFGDDAADQAFCVSTKMIPARLQSLGFTFEDPAMAAAMPSILRS